MVGIRRAVEDDAAAWADVVRLASPHLVVDAASEAHEMRTDPVDAQRLVAEDAGHVVGVARSRTYPDEDHVSLLVMVAPTSRRQGIGGKLFDRLLAGVADNSRPRAIAIVEDDEGSRIASQRWGFSIVRTLQNAALDPRTVTAPETLPPGVSVVPLGDVGSETIWQAHQQVARDDPSGLTLPMSFEQWTEGWSDPRGRPDLGRAVLVDGTLAAYTMIGVAGDRAWSEMTGTLPPYRGRGVALLAKQHALVAAAAAGVTRATTGNDGANLPMLAVKRRLGYRLVARPALAERALG